MYETTNHPIARQMLGYLFARGGVPNIPAADFKEARQFTDKGMHGKLYRFSETDFEGIRQLWTARTRSTARRSR